MAIDLTAYATAAEYRERNGRVSTDSDTTLNAFLLSVSRVIDRRIGWAAGHGKAQTALTYTVTAYGGTRMYLRNERGEQLFLRTATAVGIDTELDNTYDGVSLVLGTDAWLRGYPRDAATSSEPYTALELLPGVANADPVVWTDGMEVRITGNWGWATTPGAIKDRVIGITRELTETHFGGPSVDEVAAAIDANYGARSLMRMLEQEYSRRLPV